MPTTIDEGRLRFLFDDSWYVIKYDDHRDYRERIGRLEGSKAVDLVAVRHDLVLYFIEIKDFRGFRIENQDRLREGELALEVGQKVRDTIAGIVAAQHRGNEADWGQSMRRMISHDPPVHVLLWLEDDLPPGPSGRRANRASVLNEALKRRLSWLTPRVFVVDLKSGRSPDGLTVTNLPGAGRAT